MRDSKGLGWRVVGLGLTVIAVAVVIVMSVAGPGITAPKHHFKDNGDGTITDNETGLMWTKTTGVLGTQVPCAQNLSNCPDQTNVNNVYTWSVSGTEPDGTLFTDFLATMNCALMDSGGTCGPGLYRDWRIPTVAEWNSIVDCSLTPCLDPVFGPSAGHYWSITTFSGEPFGAFEIHLVAPFPGSAGGDFKNLTHSARAVRGG